MQLSEAVGKLAGPWEMVVFGQLLKARDQEFRYDKGRHPASVTVDTN